MRDLLYSLISAPYKIKNYKKNKDYTLGLPEAINCRKHLSNKAYDELEEIVNQLDSDKLTLVVDCLSLSFKEAPLLAFFQQTKNKDLANLLLGTHYLHQAWRARSHRFARNVSEKQILLFFEFQEKSEQRLEAITETDSLIGIEATSRLIRYSMGNGDLENAKYYYDKVIEKDPNNLWAHLHYCEVIQPKWGGNLSLIAELMLELKSRRELIQQVTELKLILDSFTLSKNYFGGSMKDLKVLAKQRLNEIDKAISLTPSESIHKYIVYNYLHALGDTLGKNIITIKNCTKMNGYYTLYPCGVIR